MTTRSSPSSRAMVRARPTPGASPNGWTSTIPVSPPRFITAASRSTHICSVSNDTMPRQLIGLASRPVDVLKGVGPKKVEALAELDITNLLELVTHYPRRYLDRTNQVDISDLVVGEEAMVLAVVKRVATRRTRTGKAMVEVDVFDGSSYLKCTFFNQGWRAKQLSVGTEAVYFGKVDWFRGRRQMTNPVVDLIGDRTGRIVPVYPQSDKAGLT